VRIAGGTVIAEGSGSGKGINAGIVTIISGNVHAASGGGTLNSIYPPPMDEARELIYPVMIDEKIDYFTDGVTFSSGGSSAKANNMLYGGSISFSAEGISTGTTETISFKPLAAGSERFGGVLWLKAGDEQPIVAQGGNFTGEVDLVANVKKVYTTENRITHSYALEDMDVGFTWSPESAATIELDGNYKAVLVINASCNIKTSDDWIWQEGGKMYGLHSIEIKAPKKTVDVNIISDVLITQTESGSAPLKITERTNANINIEKGSTLSLISGADYVVPGYGIGPALPSGRGTRYGACIDFYSGSKVKLSGGGKVNAKALAEYAPAIGNINGAGDLIIDGPEVYVDNLENPIMYPAIGSAQSMMDSVTVNAGVLFAESQTEGLSNIENLTINGGSTYIETYMDPYALLNVQYIEVNGGSFYYQGIQYGLPPDIYDYPANKTGEALVPVYAERTVTSDSPARIVIPAHGSKDVYFLEDYTAPLHYVPGLPFGAVLWLPAGGAAPGGSYTGISISDAPSKEYIININYELDYSYDAAKASGFNIITEPYITTTAIPENAFTLTFEGTKDTAAAKGTFKVKTNWPKGYKITAQLPVIASAAKQSGAKLSPLTADGALTENTFAFAHTDTNTAPQTYKAPKGIPVQLYNTTSYQLNEKTHNIWLGAKIGMNLPTGKYKGRIKISIITNF
jgi:hypothetical protein